MTVERLARVLWRLREKYPNRKSYTYHELRRCIMIECGTDPKTYYSNKDALKRLKWIKPLGKVRLTLTDKDIDDTN